MDLFHTAMWEVRQEVGMVWRTKSRIRRGIRHKSSWSIRRVGVVQRSEGLEWDLHMWTASFVKTLHSYASTSLKIIKKHGKILASTLQVLALSWFQFYEL